MTPFTITGHRGAMGCEPENTLRSFRRAVADGANEIEFDLRLSRDGDLMVIHDARVDRTTDGCGAVADFTTAGLRALDAGGGERIPLFAEVVAAVDVALQIEVKESSVVPLLVDHVRAHSAWKRRMFPTGFDAEIVAALAAAMPDVEVGLISRVASEDVVLKAAAIGARRVLVGWDGTTPELLDLARRHGMRYCIWPVNDEAQLSAAAKLRVGGFTTDDPALVGAAGYAVRGSQLRAPTDAVDHVR